MDLEVYQNTFHYSLKIEKEILPKLPDDERYLLKDQMRRASRGIPPLIAEGFAKRHQKKNWSKYLDDALGECNEMIVHLAYTKALYLNRFDPKILDELIDIYDKSGKQLYNLKKSWLNFHP